MTQTAFGARAQHLEVDPATFFDHAYERGWTDGLPVFPPTPAAVEALLAHTQHPPEHLIGHVPPRWGELTVERAAINAVMAGCRPEYFPVVLAACEAILDEEFNLYGVQATTNPVSPTIIVNGPVAGGIGINAGYGCLGPGVRANMTIGRTIRLILRNPGGGEPGRIDRATQGYPGKLSLCFAENEAESPWSSLSADRGFGPGDSVVTVYQGTGTFNILDAISSDGVELLTTMARSMTGIGSNNMQLERGEALVVVCPEHARIIHERGIDKDGARRFLWANSMVRGSDLPAAMRGHLLKWRGGEFAAIVEHTAIPLVKQAEDVVIVVAGGAGPHSCFIPGFSDGAMVSRRVEPSPVDPIA